MPTPVPEFVKRKRRRDVVSFGWISVGIVVATLAPGPSRVLKGVVLAAMVALLAWNVVSERRLRRRLRESGYRLCPACGQSLVGLPDEGICPECGCAYDVEEYRRMWAAWGYGSPREARGS